MCNADGVDNCVPFRIRKKALEESSITELLLDFLLIAPHELESNILFLIHQILISSVQCARNLLKNRDSIPQLILFNNEIKNKRLIEQQKKQMIINILWLLLECEDKKTFSSLPPLPVVVLKALRSWLRCAVLGGSPLLRNDILGVICRVLYNYDNLDITQSGLLTDLFLLSSLTDCNINETWASGVKFKGDKEDAQFKKLLLITQALLLKNSCAYLVALDYNSLENVAILLDPFNKNLKTKWSDSLKWDLLLYAINIIPFFAPHFPDVYVKCGITGRLLFLIEYFSTKKIRSELVCCCVKTLHLVLLKHIVPVDHFRQLHAFEVLISFAKTILYKSMSTLFQVALSYTFCILKELCESYSIDCRLYDDLIYISLNALNRFLKPDELDYKTDECLIIATGSFIWSCVNRNTEVRKLLIQKGMVYLVLDIIESSAYPIQLLYTGMLADIALDVYSVIPFVTWRGKTEDMNIFALLCHLWRNQEKSNGVKRAENGCAVDTEQILLGSDQKRVEPEVKSCPPLLDLYGCIRPKVYAIVTLLLRTHYSATQRACELYGLRLMDINLKNEITLKLIQYYEHIKKGEIWENMLGFIKQNNADIYPVFLNYLEMLVSRHYSWGVDVLQEQYFLIKDDVLKAKNEEKDLYEKLKKCLAERESKAFGEVHYYLSTSDGGALNWLKENYLTLLEKQRTKHDYNLDEVNLHLTHNLNVYMQLDKTGRHFTINNTNLGFLKQLESKKENILKSEID
ncbi:cilia- and flagella-associated protein 69-like isoform X3 [Rhodnius prolixus]